MFFPKHAVPLSFIPFAGRYRGRTGGHYSPRSRAHFPQTAAGDRFQPVTVLLFRGIAAVLFPLHAHTPYTIPDGRRDVNAKGRGAEKLRDQSLWEVQVASPEWISTVFPGAVSTRRAPVGAMSTAVPEQVPPSAPVTATRRPRVMQQRR